MLIGVLAISSLMENNMREYGYEDVVWWTTTLADNATLLQVGFFVGLLAIALLAHWLTK